MSFSTRSSSFFHIPLLQPLGDLGGELSLAFGAHVYPNVARIQTHVFGILAPHLAGEKITGAGGNQVVISAVKI
jgi:hypothetical protein